MRALRWFVVVAVGIVGVVALSAATRNRPDEVRTGTEAEVTFVVQTRDWGHGHDTAATAVWGNCVSTLSLPSVPVDAPAVTEIDASSAEVRVVIRPAPGTNAVRRLRGCLNDALVDRVKSHVTAWEERPAEV